ncbi:hypothetical protein PDE_03911 [Penicillium oxalicum 114-2]|uniref:Uncharacterized protein n=2 Tax=Penicillium oxalicum TaxID=69781 RepID=S7ZE84_PENO1|nr:hypothetical protein PDE_03911 [Penicillium oxalicum 114-2]
MSSSDGNKEQATLRSGLQKTMTSSLQDTSHTVGDVVSGLGATLGGAAEGAGQTVAAAAEGLGAATRGFGQSMNRVYGGDDDGGGEEEDDDDDDPAGGVGQNGKTKLECGKGVLHIEMCCGSRLLG